MDVFSDNVTTAFTMLKMTKRRFWVILLGGVFIA